MSNWQGLTFLPPTPPSPWSCGLSTSSSCLHQAWLLGATSMPTLQKARGSACAHCASRVWLCVDPMSCNLPTSSVHGILQARMLEWAAISSSRGSYWPRDQTWVSCVSCISRWVLLSLNRLGSPPFRTSSPKVLLPLESLFPPSLLCRLLLLQCMKLTWQGLQGCSEVSHTWSPLTLSTVFGEGCIMIIAILQMKILTVWEATSDRSQNSNPHLLIPDSLSFYCWLIPTDLN